MSTESNINIASEIDEIIARAMAEYNAVGNNMEVISTDSIVEQSEPVSAEPEHQELPPNSESILVDETTSRFSSAIWFDNIQTKTITLAGLGGIGSYVGFLLSRMHPNQIVIYDDDVVEAANLSGQLYNATSVGRYKASALNTIMAEFSSFYNTFSMEQKFTESSTPTDIMICGFDNMVARRVFFNAWKQHVSQQEDPTKCLFIDGRLAAESFQVLCITGGDTYSMNKYEREYLFSDREAETTVCSYKQTSFMANMIGSVMVNLFVNFCANECEPLIPRDLPFFTEYNAETMYFKVVA